LIDVREYHEFARKRIKGSVNIPSSGNLEFTADTLDKNCILFIYCLNNYRSVRVANLFYDKGFRKLYSLEGGITAWRRDGFKVVRGPGKSKRKLKLL
jgi:rhodanese-related sulfurtransferase